MGILDTFNIAKKSKSQLKNLGQLNQLAAALLAFQAIIILILAKADVGTRSIATSFLTSDPQTTNASGGAVLAPAVHHLFDLNLAYLVAAFLLVAAVIRLAVATHYRRDYEKDLKKGCGRARWTEFGVVGGLIMVTLAAVTGVSDLSLVILIFGLVCIGAFLNYQREVHNHDSKTNAWFNMWGGIKTSLAPMLVVAIYLWGAYAYGQGLPAYIYWLDGSLLVLFVAWAWLFDQSVKKRGRWADYLKVEQAYIVLTLVATAALAWQIYAGTLRG